MLARSVERLEGLEADLVGRGLEAKGYACDVSDPAQIARILREHWQGAWSTKTVDLQELDRVLDSPLFLPPSE